MLRIAVENSDDDINNYKLDQQPCFFACKRCKHRWVSTMGEMSDRPECPRCNR